MASAINPRTIRRQRRLQDPHRYFLDSHDWRSLQMYLPIAFRNGSSTAETARFV
jgi:hypothetical protein